MQSLAQTDSEVIIFQINIFVLLIISFENSLFVLDLCYNRILILTKVMILSKNTFGIKKARPSKVESYLEMNRYMSRLATTRSDIRMQPRPSILNTSTTLNTL